MKAQPPHNCKRYQHPFGQTSRASGITLTDPRYRTVAGGETGPSTKPTCHIPPPSPPPLFFFIVLGLPVVLLPISLSSFLVLYFRPQLVVFGSFDFNVTSVALIPPRSTAHRQVRRIYFLFLGLLFVVYVFGV
jgi:hypothetical protein